MSLRTSREILVTPGPTMIPDEVLGAMHRPTVDLYSEALHEVTLSSLADGFKKSGLQFGQLLTSIVASPAFLSRHAYTGGI